MIQLVYLSSTRRLLSTADLLSILTSSRRNNTRDGITGVLLYKSGSVIQVLEGDAGRVHALFEVIKKDRRHHQVTLIYDKPIAHRNFADWAMGFQEIGGGVGGEN